MSTSRHCSSSLGRIIIRAAIGVLGVLVIVGSGGGGGALVGFPDYVDPGSLPPSVTVSPSRITVKPADTVVFTAFAFNAATYQWRRNGVDIAGARSRTYQLVGTNLGDDGAQFSIVVTNGSGTATATAVLQVSPFPPTIYEDGEFEPANWTAQTVRAEPAEGGHKVTVSRRDSGGNPGAYRSIGYEMPAGPSSIDVVHFSLSATYDPATEGPIYGVDFRLACIGTGSPEAWPAIEQAGRRFVRDRCSGVCFVCSGHWLNAFDMLSLQADEFFQLDGPACGPSETCPDFSETGAPIRFGFLTEALVGASQPATPSQGIDNWKVMIWRR